ncbi:hypothetical protein [Actinospica robiniae]|uniref:hypothetical protein n=1 Tax=Actinospica robiniae TaxID=304901 RepID=UPI000559972D|nr:hypothetical protein [Actinospica robiniae]
MGFTRKHTRSIQLAILGVWALLVAAALIPWAGVIVLVTLSVHQPRHPVLEVLLAIWLLAAMASLPVSGTMELSRKWYIKLCILVLFIPAAPVLRAMTYRAARQAKKRKGVDRDGGAFQK